MFQFVATGQQQQGAQTTVTQPLLQNLQPLQQTARQVLVNGQTNPSPQTPQPLAGQSSAPNSPPGANRGAKKFILTPDYIQQSMLFFFFFFFF
jgi:hypothetical protein